MEAIVDYLVKVSVGLALICIFYYLVLRRLTFYQWNRVYLLSHGILCFILPLVDISPWMQQQQVNKVISSIPSIGLHATTSQEPRVYPLLMTFFAAGVAMLSFKLVIQYFSLQKMKRHAALIHEDEELRLYKTDRIINPFSFGKSVFVNPGQHDDAELESIIQHEIVHVRQKHGIDLVIAEFICVLNWYNPFAWLIRMAIRQNLEFIADNKVLDKGYDKTAYQYLLLKVVGLNQFSVANHFSFSNLKNRIIMINRIKSARLHLTRFLFAVPLLACILFAFRTEWTPQNRTTLVAVASHPVADSLPRKASLVIVNGEKKPLGYDINKIPQEQIATMTVLKGREAEKRYGAEGKNGVIEITLKEATDIEANGEHPVKTAPEIDEHRVNPRQRPIKEVEQRGRALPEDVEEIENLKELKAREEQIQQDVEAYQEKMNHFKERREAETIELQDKMKDLEARKLEMLEAQAHKNHAERDMNQKEQLEQLERMRQSSNERQLQQQAMIDVHGRELTDLDEKMNVLDKEQARLRSKLQADMNKLVSDYKKKMEKLNRRKEKLDR